MELIYHSYSEVGTDEAGRGCLAGVVTAAAVVLPKDFYNKELNDSKLLTEKQRDRLRLIIEKEALSYSVSHISPKKIDEINILQASILAMHKAIEGLEPIYDFIIVDGNKFLPFKDIPYKTIIKGDASYVRIAAASVLAKTHRDEYMMNIHKQYPEYGWDKNKGYPTKEHREAIVKYGITPYHRLSFNLYPTSQLKLEFE